MRFLSRTAWKDVGDHWIVRNFGVGGRTMLKKGDFPYWKEDAWAIDLYSALSGKVSLFPDQIHPNAEGAGLMAQTIAKKLTGRDITVVNSEYPGEKTEWHGFTYGLMGYNPVNTCLC